MKNWIRFQYRFWVGIPGAILCMRRSWNEMAASGVDQFRLSLLAGTCCWVSRELRDKAVRNHDVIPKSTYQIDSKVFADVMEFEKESGASSVALASQPEDLK